MLDKEAYQPTGDVEVVYPWVFYGTELSKFLQNCKQTKHRRAKTTQQCLYLPIESLHLFAKQLFGQTLNLFWLQTNRKFSSSLHPNKMSYIG